MNNRKMIFAAIIGVVFLFAGYNLYSYFQNQAEIAAEEERLAQERQLERDRAAAEQAAAQQAEQARQEAERAAQRAAEEQRRQEEAKAREEARLAEEARQAAEEARLAEENRLAEAERLRERIAKVREIKSYEGIWYDKIEGLQELSARYVQDHPEEFNTQLFSAANFGVRDRSSVKVFFDNSTPLMLYAAISQDTRLLQALIDTGIDVNATNDAGVTALMFAATYNNPEVVAFLIGQGADTGAIAYRDDMNALHFAAKYNPNPDTAEALVKAGLALESKTSKGMTPALLAASDNRNMEVVARLAELGADTGAYDESGVDVVRIVKARFEGNREPFLGISPEFKEQVLVAIQGR